MRERRAEADHALPGVRPFLWALLSLALLLVACAPPAPFNSTEVSGIDYGRGLRIADTNGEARSLEDFADSVTLVFFGFTSCPDVCPSTLLRLKQARAALGTDARHVTVLLVSVDPQRDTPERLRAYLDNFDPSFVGLRPTPEQLPAVVKAFHAIAVQVPSKDGSTYTVDHSSTLYVYDRHNRLRLIAQPDFAMDAFVADLRRLVAKE
ncbi:MAG: SCO family protein [Sinobacteraceae bacterium]|nr:SCO family protein [Nevskiaceae bacterium]